MKLTDDQLILQILDQQEREKITPKLEVFRNPKRIKGCRGGRGAGAKSWSIASLLVQKANYKPLRIACLREVQQSLQESVYFLIKQTIDRLGYEGWKATDEYILSPCGSYFIFRGLKDLRAANQIKGLEAFDIAWLEEASSISMESLIKLIPTMRKPGSEIWFSYNPETEDDPITVKLWDTNRDDAILIELEAGRIDNPWWTDELQKEMDEDYKNDPDLAMHVWGGQPRTQGLKSILSRIKISAAMKRELKAEGGICIGCDPADFGDDKTQIYKIWGLKVVDHKEIKKQDGGFIANEIGRMINFDPSIPIKIDTTGIGTSARDHLRELGLKVIPINFAESAFDSDKYYNVVAEMYGTLPIDGIDIPEDRELMQELSGRRYDYDNKNRIKLEPKDEFKKRILRSPDKADALCLAYYNKKNFLYGQDFREGMRERRLKNKI